MVMDTAFLPRLRLINRGQKVGMFEGNLCPIRYADTDTETMLWKLDLNIKTRI